MNRIGPGLRVVAYKQDKRHAKNNTHYKTLDYICDDPRVVTIWDEGEDGIWIQLAEGYNIDGCSCVHEWNVRDLMYSFENNVEEGPTY
jgi:hypothetical protein